MAKGLSIINEIRLVTNAIIIYNSIINHLLNDNIELIKKYVNKNLILLFLTFIAYAN